MTRRATIRRHPERAEQAACLKILRLLGAEVYVLGTTRKRGDHPGTMMTPGLPDLYAFLPMGPPPAAVTPWPMWIEVKAPVDGPAPNSGEFAPGAGRAGIGLLAG